MISSRNQLDRSAISYVSLCMRMVLLLSFVGVWGTACGGKKKSPKSAADIQSEEIAGIKDKDPDVTGLPTESGNSETPPAEPQEPGEEPEGEDDSIRPPNLDLPPGEQRAKRTQHSTQGWSALRAGDPDRAIREAKLALKADSTHIDSIVLLAHANFKKNRVDTAEVILDSTFNKYPEAKTNAKLFYLYGLIYESKGEERKAIFSYEKCIQYDPSHRGGLINVGAHRLKNKQYAEAIQIFERLTRSLGVNTSLAWNNLGSAYRGRSADGGARDQLLLRAEQAYKKAVELNRNDGYAYYNLGLLYYDADPFPTSAGPMGKLQRLEKAEYYFKQYREKSGADVELVDDRIKRVKKLIKREKRKQGNG